MFLERIEGVSSSTKKATDDDIAGWTAQARTLRALKTLGSGDRNEGFPQTVNLTGSINDIDLTDPIGSDGEGDYFKILFSGDDPFFFFNASGFDIGWEVDNTITFSFRYKSDITLDAPEIFFHLLSELSGEKAFQAAALPPTGVCGRNIR